jgi:glycosyltransferase involved in cell wall biosynthesis
VKVVQVTHRYPPQVGGVETHVEALATRLASAGHDVTVVTADGCGDRPATQHTDGVEIIRHRGLAPGDAFHVAPGIARTVRRLDADVVHAHNYHALPLVVAAVASQAPLVATPHYHATSASRVRDALLTAYEPIGRWALQRADRVLAVSAWERDRLATDFGVDAQVVPNGVDRRAYNDVSPASRARPYLLCVGRLAEYKGVQFAIRALPQLPEFDLVVAGTGPYRTSLEQVAQSVGVRDRVEFTGYVADAELRRLYAGASVSLSLSTHEAFGLTVAEALASGTPCVVRSARALAAWGTRPDCIAIDAVAAAPIASAVRAAETRPAPAAPVPTWEATASQVRDVYSELLE